VEKDNIDKKPEMGGNLKEGADEVVDTEKILVTIGDRF